jgi:hypothetical protein
MDENQSPLAVKFAALYNRYILAKPLFVLVLLAIAAAFFGWQATHVRIDASADALVLEGDEDLDFYREVAQRYSAREWLVIAYQPKQPLLSDVSLAALAALVDDLQAIEGVYSVMSLLDVPLLYSPKVSITALSGKMATLRDTNVDRALAADELLHSPIYKSLLSSSDGNTAALQINLKRDQQYRQLLTVREHLRNQQPNIELRASHAKALDQAEQAFKDYSVLAAERQQQLVASVRAVIDAHRMQSEQIFLGGVPMIANDMVTFVKNDLQTFGVAILIFIVVLLAFIFRAPRWVLLPLAACMLTNLFMLGLLGWLDWRMTVVSSNFVALLLIITLAISIHLVVYYRELELLSPEKSHRELALATAVFMFKPCLYTALTTVVAFMSLVISGIRPIIDFGWMMTLGVMMALLVTFIVVPAGMALLKPAAAKKGAQGRSNDVAFTLHFARITERFGTMVFAIAALLAIIAVTGMFKLKVENRFIDYFDAETEIYQGMELVDRELGGTIPLDIILFESIWDVPENGIAGLGNESASDDEFSDDFDDQFSEDFDGDVADEFSDDFGDEFNGDIADPKKANNSPGIWFTRAGMERVGTIHRYVESLDETGKVLSLATIYDVANDLLGGGIDDIQLMFAYKNLPESIQGAMINPYLNVEKNETRITVRVKETSRSLNRNELLEHLHSYMQDELGYAPEQYRLTGMLVLYNNMLQSLFKSQILTLGMVFIAIVTMLTFLFRSMMLALICVVPNMLAALLVLGGMGWAGLPLDMMTITIAAISVGIGVDDTIHYVHRFRREFALDRNYIQAMYRSHSSIGRAMYYTSVIIIFGFSILVLSNFKPSIYFGLLTGAAMLSALLGALMLLPKLLIAIKPLGLEKS